MRIIAQGNVWLLFLNDRWKKNGLGVVAFYQFWISIVETQQWSTFMEEKSGQTLPSREQHSSCFCLPHLFPPAPCLAVPRPEPTMQSDHAVVEEVFLSGLHQCVLSSSGKYRDGTTEDINLLIWPWWHAYSTHSPPPHHPFLLSASPWALFLVTHTLFWVCCACGMSLNTALECSCNLIVVASYIPEALAVSVYPETFKVSEEVVGGRL